MFPNAIKCSRGDLTLLAETDRGQWEPQRLTLANTGLTEGTDERVWRACAKAAENSRGETACKCGKMSLVGGFQAFKWD